MNQTNGAPSKLRFIEIDDQFRRSRRNTLLACVVSFLISLSVIYDPLNWGPDTVLPYFDAVRIPRPVASSLAFIAAIYFYIGFSEEVYSTTTRNSSAVVGGKLEQTARKAEKIQEQLAEWLESRQSALEYYKVEFTRIKSYSEELTKVAQKSLDSARLQMEVIHNAALPLEQMRQDVAGEDWIVTPGFVMIAESIDEIIRVSQGSVGEELRDYYKRTIQTAQEWERAPSETMAIKMDEDLSESVKALNKLNEALRRLDDSFGERGQEFYIGYEINVVRYCVISVLVAFEASLALQALPFIWAYW